MFFLVISPQRHRASQSLHREIHFPTDSEAGGSATRSTLTLGGDDLSVDDSVARLRGLRNPFWLLPWGSASLHPRLYAFARSARWFVARASRLRRQQAHQK